jgi:hypothetical protein
LDSSQKDTTWIMARKTQKSLLNFNGGIWSSKLDGRIDLEKYSYACRQLENFLIRPYGMIERRPGTRYSANTKGNAFALMWEFQFSTEVGYTFEVGDGYIRFYENGVQIESPTDLAVTAVAYALVSGEHQVTYTAAGHNVSIDDVITVEGISPGDYNTTNSRVIASTSTTFTVVFEDAPSGGPIVYTSALLTKQPYELVHPYAEADLREVQRRQVNDVVYLTHKDYEPYILRRLTTTPTFDIAPIVFDLPPFRDENVSAITLQPTGTTGAGTTVELQAKAPGWATATYYKVEQYLQLQANVTGGSWTAGQITFTVAAGHPFNAGDMISVRGVLPSLYNITQLPVDAVTGTTIVVTAPDPGGFTSATGTVEVYGSIYKCIAAHTSGTFSTDLAAANWEKIEVFTTANVNGHYRLGHRRESRSVELQLLNTANTPTNGNVTLTNVLGDWTLSTQGAFDGKIQVKRIDPVTAIEETVYEAIVRDGRRALLATGTNEVSADLKLIYSDSAKITDGMGSGSLPSTSYEATATLEAAAAYIYGYGKMTTYIGDTIADVLVVDQFESTKATDIWAESSWSPRRGYPRTCDMHEQRIVYAGNIDEPLKIWGSRIGEFYNFKYGINDTHAFSYGIPATEQNPIEWIIGGKSILVGTGKEYGILSSGSDDLPITPTNAAYRSQEAIGFNHIKPRIIGPIFAGVERNGRRLREIAYDFTAGVTGGYKANDLNRLNDEISSIYESGGSTLSNSIVDIAYAQLKEPYIYCVLDNGEMGVLSYNRDDNVAGWSKFTTNQESPIPGGKFLSVAILRGTVNDEIYMTVEREINGTTKRFVEYFEPSIWPTISDAFYVDCGVDYTTELVISAAIWTAEEATYTTGAENYLQVGDRVTVSGISPSGWDVTNAEVISVDSSFNRFTISLPDPTTTYSSGGTVCSNRLIGLTHLAGETVVALGDGSIMNSVVVEADGSVKLPVIVNKGIVGIPYYSVYEPMRLDIDSIIGSSQGHKKMISEINLRVNKSVGCSISNGTVEDVHPFNSTEDLMDVAVPVFTGEKRINWNSTLGDEPENNDPKIIISQKQPLPLSIISLIVKYKIF